MLRRWPASSSTARRMTIATQASGTSTIATPRPRMPPRRHGERSGERECARRERWRRPQCPAPYRRRCEHAEHELPLSQQGKRTYDDAARLEDGDPVRRSLLRRSSPRPRGDTAPSYAGPRRRPRGTRGRRTFAAQGPRDRVDELRGAQSGDPRLDQHQACSCTDDARSSLDPEEDRRDERRPDETPPAATHRRPVIAGTLRGRPGATSAACAGVTSLKARQGQGLLEEHVGLA